MKQYYTTILFLIFLVTKALSHPICHIQRYDENDGLTQWHVTQMMQDRQGMMWFATWNGICRYDGYGFKGFKGHVGDGNKISTDRFRNIWLTDDGNIGCNIDDELFLFNMKTCRFESRKDISPNHKHAKSIKPGQPFRYKDRQGTVWTISHDGKITYQTSNGKETPYKDASTGEQANFCLPDMQGNLWVAGTSGVYKISFLQQHGTMVRNEEDSETKAVFIDRRERYWITTKGDNTVTIHDKRNNTIGYLSDNRKISKRFTRFSCPVYCITQAHDGTIWMGSKPGGMFRLKEQKGGTAYSIKKIQNIPNSNIYDIKEDRWGRLWVASLGGGIFCITNPADDEPDILSQQKELKEYPKQAQRARMIYITKNDVMLVATTNGLVITKLLPGKNPGKMKFNCHNRESDRKDALSCSATMNIAEDWRGRIFISTESGGVNMIKNKDLTSASLSFRHFDKSSGLPTDIAMSVVPYGKNLLIVSSNSIIILNPDTNTSTAFGKNQFLSECRFSDAVPQKLPDGNWLFGLQDGFFNINMKKMKKSAFSPNIALTDISIQGTNRNIAINMLDTLTLATNERSMTLSFAALDYSPNADIHYMFALTKGHEKGNIKWNDVGNNHSVTLLDLTPGYYELLIKSTNADGTWVDNARKLTIFVTPKFTETTAAHILLSIIITLCLAGIAYTIIYIRKIRKQRREALEAYLTLLNTEKAKKEDTPPVIKQKLSDEDDKMIRKVSAFIDEHISDSDISVNDMAKAAAISKSGLQRKMKQTLGVTPLDFLREARIKHACHLLTASTMPISEIAFACGFADPKYFSRSFKASTGKTPKEWRGQAILS